jgi:uncharacterized membrane protein YobD (UPF0266 family)
MKRISTLLLVSAALSLLGLLIYALVFADSQSVYRKNGFIIGILFISVARLTQVTIRRSGKAAI